MITDLRKVISTSGFLLLVEFMGAIAPHTALPRRHFAVGVKKTDSYLFFFIYNKSDFSFSDFSLFQVNFCQFFTIIKFTKYI